MLETLTVLDFDHDTVLKAGDSLRQLREEFLDDFDELFSDLVGVNVFELRNAELILVVSMLEFVIKLFGHKRYELDIV